MQMTLKPVGGVGEGLTCGDHERGVGSTRQLVRLDVRRR
jgi:hypothetical protein